MVAQRQRLPDLGILAVVVGSLMVANCSAVEPSMSQRSGPSQAAVGPSKVPAPSSPSPVAGPYRWFQFGGPVQQYPIRTVLERPNGSLLAFADSFDPGPHVLTSADGRTWVMDVPVGLAPPDADHATVVTDVAMNSAGGLVAVGGTALGDFSSGDAAAWTSTDGHTWVAATGQTGMGDAEMNAVIAGPGGMVAAGSDGFPGANVQLPGMRGGAIWTSATGRQWDRVSTDQGFVGRMVDGLVMGGPGYVAWGAAGPPDSAAIWTSADASRWSMAPAPSGGHWGIDRVLATDRLVAVGTWWPVDASGESLGRVPAIWTSTDGVSWAAAKLDTVANKRNATGSVGDVVTAGSGLLAAGVVDHGPSGEGGDLTLWASNDGSTWTTVPIPAEYANVQVRRLVAIPTGILLFGEAIDPSGLTSPNVVLLAEPIN